MNAIPLVTEWFFDPVYSAATVKWLEKGLLRLVPRYINFACASLEKQLARQPSKTCAASFEAFLINSLSVRHEPVLCLLLVIYDRNNFEIKVCIGTEENIRAKALDIRSQLNEQLAQPGIRQQ